MADDIHYEPLAPEREDEARALALAVFGTHVAPGFSEQGRAAFADYLTRSAFSRRSGQSFALAARQGDDLVGVIEVADGSHVALFFVAARCQGRGVGRALMHRAVDRCRRGDLRPASLTVNASPNSVGAYAKMGFAASGPEQERDGIRFVPMVLAPGNPEKPGGA